MEQIRTGSELLADEIAQKIRVKIQNQEYKAGQRLPVRLLCEEFGTSETPVKQALNQLVTTGLVVSVPKCGMRVRTFNFQDMKDNWEARLMVEQFCAASAVEMARRNERFVTRIQEILRISNGEYERCIQDYTKENFISLHVQDRALHTELVKCCQNAQIMEMYDSLNAHSGMFVGFHCHTPGRPGPAHGDCGPADALRCGRLKEGDRAAHLLHHPDLPDGGDAGREAVGLR